MCFFDFCVVDTDVDSYDGRHTHKILSQNEWCKKSRYLEACLERRHHFMLIMFPLGWGMGEDTKAETKQLSDSLSTKWDR